MIRKDESSRYLESQPIILTINPPIFPLFYWFFFLVKMVKFFGGNGQPFISKTQKNLCREKHSVCFEMIRKYESSRYLESQSTYVTTKHFLGKKLYFKWNRYLKQALNIFPKMKWATWEVERLILAQKYWKNIRHGYMYAIRTYNHGRF